jgi:alginate O-acetyltransferase complex protein AlgF
MKKILLFMACTALVSTAGFGVNAGMLKTAMRVENAPNASVIHVAANADDGLYAPVAPEGSAFVRFFNAANPDKSIEIKAGSKSYDALAFNTATSYYVVPKGSVDLTIDGNSSKNDIVAGKFYTVTQQKDTKSLIVSEDQAIQDKAKASITLYNYTKIDDAKLSATLNGKDVDIVSDVDSYKTATRELNPFELDLKVTAAEKELAHPAPVTVERGFAYGLFLTEGKDGKVQTAWIVSKTDTKK